MVIAKKIDDTSVGQEIISLNPVQQWIKTYDIVIDACDRKDASKVCAVITGLIDSLSFDYPEIAKSLLRLYEYCMDEVKSGNFDIPLKIFKETREPWVQAQGRVQADIPQPCIL